MRRLRRLSLVWAQVFLIAGMPSYGLAQQPNSTQPDWSYVTPGAVVASVVHPARILTAKEMEMLPIEIITAASQQHLGIDPIDVVSMMAVVEPPVTGPPGFGLVVHFAKPYRLDQIRTRDLLTLEDAQLDGLPYRKSADPTAPGFYMPNDRTLIAANDAMLRKMLQNKKSPQAGELSNLIARTDSSADAMLIVAVEPVRAMLVDQMANAPLPPPLESIRQLPSLIDAAKVEVKVTGSTSASLIVLSPSAQDAEELETVVNELLDMGQQMALAQMAAEMEVGDDPIQRAAAAYTERITKRIFETLRPERQGRTLRLAQGGGAQNQVVVIGILVALLLPAVQAAREAARRMQSANNMKQIAIAMHNYHATFNHFPPRANYDNAGKPLLSWRVHLLPFLDQQKLYEQFHLDEPWDSPHNRQLIDQIPAVYRNPSAASPPQTASYLVPTGPGSIFATNEGVSLAKITDGSSNTILVLEVDNEASVEWTKPQDLQYDPDDPLAGLGNAHPGAFQVATADGAVHVISSGVDPTVFLRLLMMADGNAVRIPD